MNERCIWFWVDFGAQLTRSMSRHVAETSELGCHANDSFVFIPVTHWTAKSWPTQIPNVFILINFWQVIIIENCKIVRQAFIYLTNMEGG